MRDTIKIGNRIIGEDQPLFITAEVGVTCNYDMGLSKELIDVVSSAGADAIKFIFWFPEEIMSDRTVLYEYETEAESFISVDGIVSLKKPILKTENMFDMLDKLRFTLPQWKEIKEYADKKRVILFSTVNSPSGINYAEALGLDAYKLSSWDYNYTLLLKNIAALGKPMIIDTGPVNVMEVMNFLQRMKDAKNDQIILVHCTHADKSLEMNMKSIPYMRNTFGTLVGYSSGSRDSDTDIIAISLGAVYLEKRLTMSRYLPGHHHILSKEPQEFERYVKLMREVHASLGVYNLIPSKNDLKERKRWFRHIVANCDISEGTKLLPGMLEGKRPEKGISPEHIDSFIGKKVNRDLKENDALSWEDV